MNRLLESKDGGPAADKARDLLRTMEPLPESQERMDRIRRAIRTRGATPVRRLRLPMLLAATFVLLAVSAAAAGSGLIRRWLATPAVVASPVSVSLPERAPPSTKALEPSVELSAEQAPAMPIGPSAPSSFGRPTRFAAPSASEVALIHDAAKALRHDRDPERAARLLGSVSGKGPLAEEALALRIEAALARQDPGAAALARDYLAQYPQGRYRGVASRALRP